MPTNPVTITVTGHAERSIAPNRGVVHLNIEFDAATRAEAADAAISSAAALTQLVGSLEKDAARPLRRWSLDQMQHTRYRPYHPQGKKLPWNYRSTATAAVTFRDLDAVASFVDRTSAIEGVNITHLEWKLTRTAHAKALSRVWDLAVRDALTKAKGYTPESRLQAHRGRRAGRPGDAECGTATGLRTAGYAGDGSVGSGARRRQPDRRTAT